MVHSLLRVQLGYGWQNTKCVSGQENNVFRVSTYSRKLDVADMFKRVTYTCVLGQARVVVVDRTWSGVIWEVLDVFYDCSETDSVKDIGLLLSGETVTLGVTATLNVKDVFLCPNVLVVSN